jgi:leucyl aminopeptidase (aminopeptidase T)
MYPSMNDGGIPAPNPFDHLDDRYGVDGLHGIPRGLRRGLNMMVKPNIPVSPVWRLDMMPTKAADPLYVKVAHKVLSETIGLKKGESLTIETWSNSLPFALTVSLEAKKLGAFPLTIYEDEASYTEGVRSTPKDALGVMGKHESALLSGSDAYVFIPGPPIAAFSKQITRQEYVDSTKYNESWYKAAEKAKLRGARLTFGYVGEDIAGVYGRSPDAIARHQLQAALVDFAQVGKKAKEVAGSLVDGRKVAVKGEGISLSFELKGELEIQDGRTDSDDVSSGNNVSYVPPGFVYKEVDSSSVSGKAKLSPTLTRFGLLEDAALVFEGGKIVHWSSKKSPAVLRALGAAIPEKSRVLYGVTVGINPRMKFGFGQDRFPSGSVGLVSSFAAILRAATLKSGDSTIVKGGALQ